MASIEQQKKQEAASSDKDKQDKKLEGLPVETSPYTQYTDLEDYKRQGYGAEGHKEVKAGRGAAGSTDAPTVSEADPKTKS